jgi:hypothetical protein
MQMLRQLAMFLVAIAVASPAISFAADKPAEDVKLTISTDKKVYRVGDGLHIKEEFKNVGNHNCKILDESCYRGSDLEVRDAGGPSIQWQAGKDNHTLKPGVDPGSSHLLKPGQVYNRVLTAYVSKDYALIFERHKSGAITGYFPGAKETSGLPAEFIGCGRIFPLGKPGNYSLKMTYLSDFKTWSFNLDDGQPCSTLWDGKLISNEVTIRLQ